tara:strand:- start:3708 stop:4025 length:318 start_codon:yes stop_codon:yes gene_type:complete
MKSLDYSLVDSLGADEALEKALTKLNARELATLNTYIAKQNNTPLGEAMSLLPAKTPAQKIRIEDAVKLYKKLEIRNGNYAKSIQEVKTESTTENTSREEAFTNE